MATSESERVKILENMINQGDIVHAGDNANIRLSQLRTLTTQQLGPIHSKTLSTIMKQVISNRGDNPGMAMCVSNGTVMIKG